MLIGVLYSCTGATHDDAQIQSGWSAARIDSLIRRMPGLLEEWSVPGVAIALIAGKDVQWASGFGETGRGGEVTPQTIFQAASLGKPMFAHITARLAAQRGWELQEPIAGWSTAMPEALGAVTAEQLLSHTSGVRHDAVLDRLVLDPERRGHWAYSGAGYVLLQRALDAAEGLTLEELSRDVLLEPLGLRRTSYVAPDTGVVAVGHDRSGRPLAGTGVRGANAASSLHTSAADYARFVIAVAVEQPATFHWSALTQVRAGVRQDLELHWGSGWALERIGRGDMTAFHWGSNPGFKSLAWFDEARALGIVILTNGDNGLELAQRVVEILDPVEHSFFRFHMLHPDD